MKMKFVVPLVLLGCVPQTSGGGNDEDALVIVEPDQGRLVDGAVLETDLAGGGGDAAADDGPPPPDMQPDVPAAPECSNGEDDDADGFTDFPADPGCGSEQDDDEFNEGGPAMPQCSNGLDDDRDGTIDLGDPGCVSPADPREQDPEMAAACSNQVDDDGDGVTDFPLDAGCSAAGDDDESSPANPPACGNGLDDDGDGETDYPHDPGCAGVGDPDEGDPPVMPACSDGRDNDRDERVDYPDDRGCSSAADASEAGSCGRIYDPVEIEAGQEFRGAIGAGPFESEGSCGGRGAAEVVFVYRVERAIEALVVRTDLEGNEHESSIYVRRTCLQSDSEVACAREEVDGVFGNRVTVEAPGPGDYYIFLDGAAGRGGRYALVVEEVPLAQCLNGVDDDRDGRIDYPTDPGCVEPEDTDELDPEVLPQCADDEDNDGDGLIDFPLDAGCQAAADDDEVDPCGQGVAFIEFPEGAEFMLGDTAEGGSNQFQGSCGGANASEQIIVYRNLFNANLRFSLDHEETAQDLFLYARRECLGAGTEIACAPQGNDRNRKGAVTLERVGAGEYFLFVDAPFGPGGPFKLSVEVERLPPGCSDGFDGDGDGFIDGDDIGCASAADEDEEDPPAEPACWDGADNDDDGVVDYPFDPGCATKGDVDEADPLEPPACHNEADDDEDGLVDFPNDRGCSARGDDDEEDPARVPECGNSIDDDQDGLADYPIDPGCAAAGDPSERDDDQAPACADGEDNDRDGLVDFPFDPGCPAAGHVNEADPDPAAACSNGVDDDEDEITDFPRDPGCAFAADDDEVDPGFAPQCANGQDDDNNGRIDWPDDPGCRFAGDATERTDGPVPARCADGVDNDDDGVVDLADVGCMNARDDDEADEEVAPICADGEDNDEDGAVDWPDDDGCAAHGDECEQAGFGFCDDVCQDLQANAIHCGRCGRACNEGVECIEGRCGAIRPIVLVCGNSSRPVQEFIRGELVEAMVQVRAGCVPDDDTQAILLPRGGVGQFNGQAAAIRAWVENGGQLLTEYNISHTIYGSIFGIAVQQGGRNGGCQDNVQPQVQFSPNDRFWRDNQFVSVNGATGCGHAVQHFPGITPLGGWDANNVQLGYRDHGAGRVWVVEADWQDRERQFTDISRDLMAYMISGGAAAPR